MGSRVSLTLTHSSTFSLTRVEALTTSPNPDGARRNIPAHDLFTTLQDHSLVVPLLFRATSDKASQINYPFFPSHSFLNLPIPVSDCTRAVLSRAAPQPVSLLRGTPRATQPPPKDGTEGEVDQWIRRIETRQSRDGDRQWLTDAYPRWKSEECGVTRTQNHFLIS